MDWTLATTTVWDEEKYWEYDTKGSRVITDLSTNLACGCLTSQIGRDVVLSTKYGRTQHIPRAYLPRPLRYRCACRGSRPMQVLQHEVAFRSHKKTLLTYAKKVTVSVLYWYARSFRYIRQSLDTTPKGVNFFCAASHPQRVFDHWFQAASFAHFKNPDDQEQSRMPTVVM